MLSSRLRSQRRRPASAELSETQGSPAAPRTSLDFDHVHGALERLPARDATIIRLKHFEDLTFEQIAQRLAMPQSSAKADYHRAIERLRELLGKWHEEGQRWTP